MRPSARPARRLAERAPSRVLPGLAALLAACGGFGVLDDPTPRPTIPPLDDAGDDDAGDDDAGDDDAVDGDGDGVAAAEDCDDGDPAVYPGAVERCDGRDEDCDGAVDDGAVRTWWSDYDADGWGGAEVPGPCDGAPDLVEAGGDCDDDDPASYPGAPPQDGRDADCDGRNEWLVTLYISGDDVFEYCLDTEEPMLGGGGNWQTGFVFEHWLDAGNHLLGIRGWDTGRVITAAIADVRTSAGVVLVTDGAWRFDPNPAADASTRTGWCGVGFDDDAWQTAQVIGPIGTAPWGSAPAVFPPGSPAQWIWDYFPVDLNTQYLRGRFSLP